MILTIAILIASLAAGTWTVEYLPPAAFPDLPTEIRRYLEEEGCEIPQPWRAEQPLNVITGEFFAAGQSDWAVLCSVAKVARVLVFRDGGVTTVEDLGGVTEGGCMQTMTGDGEWGYSCVIAVADVPRIRGLERRDEGPAIATIEHQGIEDIFLEKASTVYYWYRGDWITFFGAD